LGLLVGVERGWQERAAAEGSRIAGIRTFGLIGLLGGLWQLLAREAGEILLAVAFLAFVVLMVTSHIAEARVSKDYGVTTLIAALITFVLGALAIRGHHVIAAMGAVVTTILLSLKPSFTVGCSESRLRSWPRPSNSCSYRSLSSRFSRIRVTVPGRHSIPTKSGGWWSSWPRSPLPLTAL